MRSTVCSAKASEPLTSLSACVLAGLLGLALLVHVGDVDACAGCRNPSLPVARGSQGPMPAGALSFQSTLSGTTVHVVHEAGCEDPATCDELPAQPLYLHDQHLYPLELRLGAEYGLSETFGVELQFPLRSVTARVHYTTPDGEPYEPLDEGNHHRDETVAGPGDPWLLFRAGTLVERFWLAARVGVSLPLGSTEEDPFELGDQGLRHQHIQFGTGTFDPVLVLEVLRRFDDHSVSLFAQGQASLYENHYGYQAPHRIYSGADYGLTLSRSFGARLGVHVLSEGQERWQGEVQQDGNLGRTELLASGQFFWTFDASELGIQARVPLYRHIVSGDEDPGELSSPLALSLSYSVLWERVGGL